MKIRNVITNEIIEVRETTDHADSSYGRPVLIDDAGNSYGEPGLLSIGFEEVSDLLG